MFHIECAEVLTSSNALYATVLTLDTYVRSLIEHVLLFAIPNTYRAFCERFNVDIL